jgi:hypothetical protein
MKRSLPILYLVMLLLLPAFQSGALALESDGTGDVNLRVEIRNRSGGSVILTLAALDGADIYRLAVPAGVERSFTVREGRYAQTTYACGGSATGTLDVHQQLRLTFPPCAGIAPNAGAPTLEKVHLSDAPHGLKWRYQYGPLLKGLGGTGSGGVAGACSYTATAEVTIYTRPDTAAQVFSTQGAGLTVQPSARSANGWLGFDPGVAQAANIGPFRLRWLPPGSGSVSPGCASLPVIWTPRAGLCYDMPMFDTNVYQNPDTGSAVLFVLHLGEFAQILGHTAGGDWVQVDLGPGNTGSHVVGWVEASTTNVNGPCSGLPVVSP